MLLKNKVAVVTGAASGIGQAAAILFAREGAAVVCIDDHPADDTMAAIEAEKARALYCCADVADSAAVQAAVHRCGEKFEAVHILFNNAGRDIRQGFEETTEATWELMLKINLTGVFLCSKYFLPLLKKAQPASIINHASVDAGLGNPSLAAYSAAKGGLVPLTHVMAQNLGKYGIRVNCLSTGGIRTGMTGKLGTSYQSRIDVTPLGRMGTSSEAAYAALFLACDWSSYVNGVNLVVDGGRTTITQGTYNG